jgi:hypothetical protein
MRPVPERYTDKKSKNVAVNSDASIFQMYPQPKKLCNLVHYP